MTMMTCRALTALLLPILAGCAVGPSYRKPPVETAAAFTEAGPWKVAAPKDQLPKDAWWKIFNDPGLDSLESQVAAGSPTVRAALARVDQAAAVAQISRSSLFPSLAVHFGPSRTRFSGNRQTAPGSVLRQAYTVNSIDLPLALSYEIDLFGRVRRSFESSRAVAEAQAADYQNVLLSLQSLVAENYFSLRELMAERDLLEHTAELRRHALSLVRDRRQGGAADDLDVYRSESELDTVESERLAADSRAAELRHELAILVGRLPENFEVATAPLTGGAPAIPLGLPSELLERRPDVAEAERTLAAFNAQIGVAKAAFFPDISLTAAAGFNSTAFSTLFNSASREWYVAPFVSLPLFQGGRITADYRRARAAYDEAVANYQGRILVAFQDVENGLSDLRYLAAQSVILDHASGTAAKASELSTARYKEGVADYFEVIDAERTALDDQLQAVRVRGQAFVSTVLLVKALGGGW